MTYLKFGAIGLLILVLFGGGWYCGSRASKTALEGFQAAQSANTAKAVLAERASAATELARVNTILKGYQDAPIDPVALSLGSRVLNYARVADCPVPSPGPAPSGTVSAGPQPGGDGGVEQALTGVLTACAQDASELTALQQAWPR